MKCKIYVVRRLQFPCDSAENRDAWNSCFCSFSTPCMSSHLSFPRFSQHFRSVPMRIAQRSFSPLHNLICHTHYPPRSLAHSHRSSHCPIHLLLNLTPPSHPISTPSPSPQTQHPHPSSPTPTPLSSAPSSAACSSHDT